MKLHEIDFHKRIKKKEWKEGVWIVCDGWELRYPDGKTFDITLIDALSGAWEYFEEPKKKIEVLAWAIKHDSHGLCIDNLFWLPEGDKPETEEDFVRLPQFDTTLEEKINPWEYYQQPQISKVKKWLWRYKDTSCWLVDYQYMDDVQMVSKGRVTDRNYEKLLWSEIEVEE